MTKSKVLDLARDVGMGDDKLILKLKRMGVKVKDKKEPEPEKAAPSSDERVIGRDAEKEVVEKRVKPTVIRRRTRTLEVKVEEAPAAPAQPALAEGFEPAREGAIRKEEARMAAEAAEERREQAIPTKGVKIKKKMGLPVETAVPAEAGLEGKVAVEPAPVVPVSREKEGVPPVAEEVSRRTELKKEAKDTPPRKSALGALGKEVPPVLKVEEGPPRKQKGVFKKRRVIEERLVEPEEVDIGHPEKEIAAAPKTFRPMKRKVLVLKSPKKTEVTVPKPIKRIIRISEVISVSELARRMGVKGGEVIRKLMEIGMMATINQTIDADVASLVAGEFGYEVERVSLERQDLLERKEDLPEQMKPRPPVVTIMGHVDHGKTLLLDAVRKTNVVDGEAGGITQHIGAYDVHLDHGHVVFIDTPGHEAFTAMRARGAKVTDIVVLVVAADDGVMPQTKEAIDHARAAKVPMVVAINKIDKPAANPDKVKKDLAEYGLMPEQWGGTNLFGEVSAKQKTGIKELLDLILLQAEVLELKANPDKPARGVIIESKLDKGRGPVATVLVQEGTLRNGDVFVAGSHYGRVRALLNDRGQKMDSAGPSMPVEVIGFTDVPEGGEIFIVVTEERLAKQISLYRQEKMREKELSKLSKVSLEDLYERITKGEVKELNVIIKADVQGSIEAMKEALRKLSTEAVRVSILHDAVGGITETDVNLASASNAIILGFNVRPGPKAQALAEQERVDLRTYLVIYDAVEDIRKAMEGLLEPILKEHLLGRAQVLQLFNISKVGAVAGSLIVNGKVVRGSHARLLRDNVVIYDGRISSLRRFKDDMKDCSEGLECGIKIENFSDLKPGDIIESYEVEEVRARLS